MGNFLSPTELTALRDDFKYLLDGEGGEAACIVEITPATANTLGPLNPTTLQYDSPPANVPTYEGPGYISPLIHRRDRTEIAGQRARRVRQYSLLIFWDSGDIQIDSTCRVAESDDPQMTDRVFYVTDVIYETHLAARRLTLTDDAAPEGDC